jgi:hypothetical protein
MINGKKEIMSDTFYDVDEDLAGGIDRHMLQQRTKNQSREKCGDIQTVLPPIF